MPHIAAWCRCGKRASERGWPPRGIKLEGVVEAPRLMFSARGQYSKAALSVFEGYSMLTF